MCISHNAVLIYDDQPEAEQQRQVSCLVIGVYPVVSGQLDTGVLPCMTPDLPG